MAQIHFFTANPWVKRVSAFIFMRCVVAAAFIGIILRELGNGRIPILPVDDRYF